MKQYISPTLEVVKINNEQPIMDMGILRGSVAPKFTDPEEVF